MRSYVVKGNPTYKISDSKKINKKFNQKYTVDKEIGRDPGFIYTEVSKDEYGLFSVLTGVYDAYVQLCLTKDSRKTFTSSPFQSVTLDSNSVFFFFFLWC